ncbi:MAG: Holliday junction branch migration protein RuvA [Pseudomonadota bacterium]|nr:Holliday junction branch migration protein RuvA [Pseudomonadota bacterium]
MIGRLRGTLVSKQPPALMIDVNGVGYELEAPMSTFYELPATGAEVTLITHYAVKEDAVALYGFHRESERTLFRTLLKVSGIGAKTALSILSGVSVGDFARMVLNSEITALTRIPGIGKKTAERIVLELRDRVEGMNDGASLPSGGARGVAIDPNAEATAALVQFGYKPPEILRLLKDAAEPGDSAETLIRKALKAALR